jgi:hypothetical protein
MSHIYGVWGPLHSRHATETQKVSQHQAKQVATGKLQLIRATYS